MNQREKQICLFWIWNVNKNDYIESIELIFNLPRFFLCLPDRSLKFNLSTYTLTTVSIFLFSFLWTDVHSERWLKWNDCRGWAGIYFIRIFIYWVSISGSCTFVPIFNQFVHDFIFPVQQPATAQVKKMCCERHKKSIYLGIQNDI